MQKRPIVNERRLKPTVNRVPLAPHNSFGDCLGHDAGGIMVGNPIAGMRLLDGRALFFLPAHAFRWDEIGRHRFVTAVLLPEGDSGVMP